MPGLTQFPRFYAASSGRRTVVCWTITSDPGHQGIWQPSVPWVDRNQVLAPDYLLMLMSEIKPNVAPSIGRRLIVAIIPEGCGKEAIIGRWYSVRYQAGGRAVN